MGMIFVLGSGFGLYGHVAALADMQHPVATLERYRSRLEERPELAPFAERITWITTPEEGFERSDFICLARRPVDNMKDINTIIDMSAGGKKHLIVEKPIAKNWQEAADLERLLIERKIDWTTPYIFLHTSWYNRLEEAFHAGRKLHLIWNHKKSPDNFIWKNNADEGGGAIAFYFIQCLAIAQATAPDAKCSYEISNTKERLTIEAEIASVNSHLLMEFVLSDKLGFKLQVDGKTEVESPSPFGPLPTAGVSDPRILPLQLFYHSCVLNSSTSASLELNMGVTAKWKELERYASMAK